MKQTPVYVIFFALLLCHISCRQGERYSDDLMVDWGRDQLTKSVQRIVGGADGELAIEMSLSESDDADNSEGFEVNLKNSRIMITGDDAAGIMYGALQLAEKLDRLGKIPDSLRFRDRPRMSLRGTCILLMKLGTYNHPVTPEEFPFFYDKELWIEYMDFLACNGFNYIALWNGHPFAYFVKLDRYPEAQAGMDQALVQKNHDMLLWLIHEGKKRNIRFMFEFYNIHTSVYYQQAHDLPAEISEPTPELENYTAYCIENFVKEFPDVGLYITPGEALKPSHVPYWLNEVIFPAVMRTGKLPPVMVRAWGIEIEQGKAVAGYYPRLFFERKFNVEMIADTRIDPANHAWAKLTGNYVVNIHCVANLEPFRWNPPKYIQDIMRNSVNIGANGLHLYPRKAWRWPAGCEIGNEQRQWERDELWFKMWGRYAWNPDRDPQTDDAYWLDDLTDRYGNRETARLLFIAFQAGADVLPALQRLLWVGMDNHTVVTAGIKLSDFNNAAGIPFLSIDPVMRIPEYFNRLKNGARLTGTNPEDFLAEKLSQAQIALEHIQEARRLALKNSAELERVEVDAKAVLLTVRFYSEKLQAAAILARYRGRMPENHAQADFLDKLRASVATFQQLSDLTSVYYESISDVPAWTPDRLKKVPYHWRDLLPLYIKEYTIYKDEQLLAQNKDFYHPVFSGLAGIWYGDPGLKNMKGPDPISSLNLDWSDQREKRESRWSAEWFGTILAPDSGLIHFSVETKQEVILEIDDQAPFFFTSKSDTADLSLAMNRRHKYSVRIIYNHYGGEEAFMKVFWRIGTDNKQCIPAEFIFHSPADKAKMERILRIRSVLSDKN